MPKRVPDEETAEKVKNYMDENPTHSIRDAVEPLKVPRSTVGFYAYEKNTRNKMISNFPHQIQSSLKKQKFHRYRPARSQALEPHHELDRKNFVKWLLEKLQEDENFLQKILFSRSQIKSNITNVPYATNMLMIEAI